MSAQQRGGTIQNPRNFTVQIRETGTHRIVGTGIIVARSGIVATCAHVVVAAGVQPRTGREVPGYWSFLRESEAARGELQVYIPGSSNRKEQTCRATMAGCFPDHDDDIVLLQLEGHTPLADEQVATLGRAEDSECHPFRSYGYRRLSKYVAAWADGTIHGPVEAPGGVALLAEPIQIEAQGINRGMSGACVLDVERNLVVGLISETWFPDESTKDRDTAWAVNARVLSLQPMGLPLRSESLERGLLPSPDMGTARFVNLGALEASPPPASVLRWTGVPAAPGAWVGREAMLQQLTTAWEAADVALTAIVGFGGEGKSALVRRWLDLAGPKSVCWWTFDESNVDRFFETAVRHITTGAVVPEGADRVHLLAALLSTGRHVFVLDGLEAVQFPSGDREGLIRNQDLVRFLRYAASPSHSSFCILTSRLPLDDLVDLPTCQFHEMPRLTGAEGRELLRSRGAAGPDRLLETIAERWDGHALTLQLLGAHLKDEEPGDPPGMEIGPRMACMPRHEQVDAILTFYDHRIDENQRRLLNLLSLFRVAARAEALASMMDAPVEAMQAALHRLDRLQIVSLAAAGTCSLHPLVREHFQPPPAVAPHGHRLIADHYLALGLEHLNDPLPTLQELAPLIEATYHLSRAGRRLQAHEVFEKLLMRGDRRYLLRELRAAATVLECMREIYFPDGRIEEDPLPETPRFRSFLLGRTGTCLLSLGRLSEAVGLFERAKGLALLDEDHHNASIDLRNLTNTYSLLGQLGEAARTAEEAVTVSRRSDEPFDLCISLAWRGWIEHLRGHLEASSELFDQAEELERRLRPSAVGITELRGVQHAIHLKRIGQSRRAREITIDNLRYSEEANKPDNVSTCRMVLAELAADAGDAVLAQEHYVEAFRVARGVANRDFVLFLLASRSLWLSGTGQLEAALRDAAEGLEIAVPGGFRTFEADFRVVLALIYQHEPRTMDLARVEARRALEICEQTGYVWARAPAEQVLAAPGG